MGGELIMLPLRVGVGATKLWLRVTEKVTGRIVLGALEAVGAVSRDEVRAVPATRPTPEPAPTATPEPAATSATPEQAATSAAPEPAATTATPAPAESRTAQEPPAPPIPQPPAPRITAPDARPAATDTTHVSEEPTIVRETADPGAEEGAGAEVTVREPWDGYRSMDARAVIARLEGATAAELAAVQLYENGNRSRQTVLRAVARRLKSANGRGSSS